MSWAAVESKARRLLHIACPERLDSPGETPVQELFEGGLRSIMGIEYGVDNLEDSEARYDPARHELTLDAKVYEGLLSGNRRDRFTVAHEIGHAHLHSAFLRGILQSRRGAVFLNRSEVPAYENPERQADVYAGEFLMPSCAVAILIRDGADADDIMDVFKVSWGAARIKFDQVERAIKVGKL